MKRRNRSKRTQKNTAQIFLDALSRGSLKSSLKDVDNRLLTLREASIILNVHPNTLRQWDRKGILIAVRFGERKDRRYRKEDIMKLVDSKTM